MNAKLITTLGGAALVFALFLPIGVIESGFLGVQRSTPGYSSDLIFAGGIGLILLLVGLAGKLKAGRRFSPLGAVLGFLALAESVWLLLRVSGVAAREGITVSAGSALYLSIIGAIVAIAGCLNKAPEAPPAPEVTPPSAV